MKPDRGTKVPDPKSPPRNPKTSPPAPSLRVVLAGIEMKNPLMAVSGTFGWGEEFHKIAGFTINDLGAVVLKGTTLKPRRGNPPPRVAETPSGVLNSIGLENPGVAEVVRRYLPRLAAYDTKIIANVCGSTVEEYGIVAKQLEDSGLVHGMEVNLSCPNVKEGGICFGLDARLTHACVAEVRRATRRPLFVKLAPTIADVPAMVRACLDGGADGISVVNTIPGMAIDLKRRRPVIGMNSGGLSGPAIKPVALLKVHEVHAATGGKVPIIGMGGVASAEDALEFMVAGARAVGVGTILFFNPFAIQEISEGMRRWLSENGETDVNGIVGTLRLNEA